VSINRYSLAGESVPNNASGRWVLYCDHAAEMREAYKLLFWVRELYGIPDDKLCLWLDAHKEYKK